MYIINKHTAASNEYSPLRLRPPYLYADATGETRKYYLPRGLHQMCEVSMRLTVYEWYESSVCLLVIDAHNMSRKMQLTTFIYFIVKTQLLYIRCSDVRWSCSSKATVLPKSNSFLIIIIIIIITTIIIIIIWRRHTAGIGRSIVRITTELNAEIWQLLCQGHLCI